MRRTVSLLLSFSLLAALVPSVTAAATAANEAANPLTPGNVTLHLLIGKTTQAEVLQVFGAPNIVTQDGQHQEVWSYQKHATVTRGSDGGAYLTLLVVGVVGSKSSSYQSERTMTLIVKFDANHIVSDFNSRSSEF